MLDYQLDLGADFRAIYRLTPKQTRRLSGPEYLALCWRTPAYAGAMQAHAAEQEEEQAQEKKTVAPTRAAIEASPLAGVIDWAGG